MRRIPVLFLFSLALFAALPAIAQESVFSVRPDPIAGEVETLPETPPEFTPVKFKKMAQARSLQERLDQLMQGITIDVPPEYDYYGYEIRRYMARIGTDEIYTNENRLAEELVNVKKARIIFNYWQEDLTNELSKIEEDMKAQNASSTIRSSYKYNSGVISAFEVECQSWLDSNEMLLDFLVKDKGLYKFDKGRVIFSSPIDRNAFSSLFGVRESARELMNEYHSFATMIY